LQILLLTLQAVDTLLQRFGLIIRFAYIGPL